MCNRGKHTLIQDRLDVSAVVPPKWKEHWQQAACSATFQEREQESKDPSPSSLPKLFSYDVAERPHPRAMPQGHRHNDFHSQRSRSVNIFPSLCTEDMVYSFLSRLRFCILVSGWHWILKHFERISYLSNLWDNLKSILWCFFKPLMMFTNETVYSKAFLFLFFFETS